MTGIVGIFVAVVAGWFVSGRRQLVMAVVLPYLVVLGIQTWGIASGRGVSPPSTVTGFPGLISYYIVQAIILALALGIALQISALRFHRSADVEARPTVAYIVNVVLAAAVVSAFQLDRPLFDPGSVSHHTSSGSPPLLGVAGIALSLLTCIVLGCVTLRRRRLRRTTHARAL